MKLPRSYYNPLSLFGSIVAVVCALIIVFFMLSSWLFDFGGSYAGIFIYLVLPAFLITGLILIPLGMARRNKRIRLESEEGEGGEANKLILDLNNSRHRNLLGIFIVGTVLLLMLTGIGSSRAFHYTETNEFCGTVCHKVMEPEYVAYQQSAHSRVNCVECHVGEGTSWYVRSKLSGLYQVYSVLFNKYASPIETPIHNLRPAREICEECHWPEKFYSHRLLNEIHYLTDSANTTWNIHLKMKIGPEHSAGGVNEGIHWHVNSDVKIEYFASDEKREMLPWVRYINTATSDTIIYTDIYESLDQEILDALNGTGLKGAAESKGSASLTGSKDSTGMPGSTGIPEIREMDCLDCHNRPSHHFLPPQEFTDGLISAGSIPLELPEIKNLAMQIFFYQSFPSRDSGRMIIANELRSFYETFYPEYAEQSPELIQEAEEGLLTGFSRHIFPEMKVSWDAYPHNAGHSEFNGCFRCHNGNHYSDDGRTISRDCELCHSILAQGTTDNLETVSIGGSLEFRHPVDIDLAWKEMACADCHRYLY